MKKSIYLLSIAVLLLLANSALAERLHSGLTPDQEKVRIHQIELRIQEIKAMDKSVLNFEERRALRKEVYQIRREMKGFTSGGVYLSAAAIVIIILVLILIL